MNILLATDKVIPLPPQAAKALKEREAKEKGKAWLEEVSDGNDELFLDYNSWAHVYEAAAKPVRFAAKSVLPSEPSIASEADVPEKLSNASAAATGEDGHVAKTDGTGVDERAPYHHRTAQALGNKMAAQFEKAQKAKLKARVLECKHENLNTLRSGLSAKLVLMVLDMSCHLLQDLEDSLEDQRPFVNAIRALVLSYRFEKPNMRRKIFHLRHVICARLVDLLDLKLQDQTLAETQLACREGLVKMETDELLEREWNAWIERFVFVKTTTTDGDRATAVPDDAVMAITGLEPPVVFLEEESIVSIREQSLELIKGFVKIKMKTVHKVLAIGLDQLLMEFAKAKFAPNTAKAALPLKEEMVNIVESIHERLLQAVTQDVSGIVDLLGDMMTLK